MSNFTHSAARTVATAALLSSVLLAGSFAFAADDIAFSASRIQLAATSTAPAKTEPASTTSDVVDKRVEAHIKELHNRLHITAAQQSQWDNLVQVMRDNAKAMMDLEDQRKADAGSMSAIDAVKSYQEVIEAHEKGMDKFVPAFRALYDSMSDAQKKAADAMFRSKVRMAAAKETK